jgi:hypothetical protein
VSIAAITRSPAYGRGVAAVKARIERTGVGTAYQVVRLDFGSTDEERAFEAATINDLDARYLRAPWTPAISRQPYDLGVLL